MFIMWPLYKKTEESNLIFPFRTKEIVEETKVEFPYEAERKNVVSQAQAIKKGIFFSYCNINYYIWVLDKEQRFI